MSLAITAGLLIAGAVYLFLRREMLRVILGFVLLGHGVNLILMAAGGASRRAEPLGTGLDPNRVADPLPQAFVLTAIVIAFAITIYLLVLAVAGNQDDDTLEPTGPTGHDGHKGHDGRLPPGAGPADPAALNSPAMTDGGRG